MLSTIVQKTSHPSKYQATPERLVWERNKTIFMRLWGVDKSLAVPTSGSVGLDLLANRRGDREEGTGEGSILLCLAVLVFASLECQALRAVLVRELENRLMQGSLANNVSRAKKSNHPTPPCLVMVFLRLRNGRISRPARKLTFKGKRDDENVDPMKLELMTMILLKMVFPCQIRVIHGSRSSIHLRTPVMPPLPFIITHFVKQKK